MRRTLRRLSSYTLTVALTVLFGQPTVLEFLPWPAVGVSLLAVTVILFAASFFWPNETIPSTATVEERRALGAIRKQIAQTRVDLQQARERGQRSAEGYVRELAGLKEEERTVLSEMRAPRARGAK